MNEPLDDENLKRFLQTNRPEVPEAHPELEERIMDLTVRNSWAWRAKQFKRQFVTATMILVPLAAVLLFAVFTQPKHPMQVQVTPTVATMADNYDSDEVGEEFLEESWSGMQTQTSVAQLDEEFDSL